MWHLLRLLISYGAGGRHRRHRRAAGTLVLGLSSLRRFVSIYRPLLETS
jgi:hypothetical protein